MNKDVNGNEYTFRTPNDWGAFTGSFIISGGEKVLVVHHAADEDEEEWTEVRKEWHGDELDRSNGEEIK